MANRGPTLLCQRFFFPSRRPPSRVAYTVMVRETATTRTVLYVEDEENDVLFMRRAFAGLGPGLGLQVVADGRDAIRYLSGVDGYGNREEYPVPALVLLDLNVPEVNGFELLRWIRSRPEYAATPVVVFSSSNRDEDKRKVQELGASEFVEKPHSALKFVEILHRLRKTWLVS